MKLKKIVIRVPKFSFRLILINYIDIELYLEFIGVEFVAVKDEEFELEVLRVVVALEHCAVAQLQLAQLLLLESCKNKRIISTLLEFSSYCNMHSLENNGIKISKIGNSK